MKKITSLILLFLFVQTGCNSLQAVPNPIFTATISPSATATKTLTPTVTPTTTPTPWIPEIYKQMQKDNVPVVSMDSTGVRIQTGIGEIFVPISGTVLHIEFREGSYVILDATKVIAAYNPNLKEAKWGGGERWVAREEAIASETDKPENYIILSTEKEFLELVDLEKVFLDPLPPDTYWPSKDDMCVTYAYGVSGDCYNALGLLDDLSKSPIKFPVNHMVWKPNLNEQRPNPWMMITSQVFNPADGSTSLLHYAESGNQDKEYLNNHYDRMIWVLSIQHGNEDLYVLPNYGLTSRAWDSYNYKNTMEYSQRKGFIKNNQLLGIYELVIEWFNSGKVPVEMEYLIFSMYPARWDVFWKQSVLSPDLKDQSVS